MKADVVMGEGLDVVGYASRLSVRAGDCVEVMVSTGSPEYEAALERVSRVGGVGDLVESSCAGRYAGREQVLPMGSYVEFDGAVPCPDGWELSAWVWPTAPGGREQALLGWGESAGLFLGADARARVRVGGTEVVAGAPLDRRSWVHVRGGYDVSAGEAFLVVDQDHWARPVEALREPVSNGGGAVVGVFAIGAWLAFDGAAGGHYDGKIEAPMLRDQRGSVVAAWDFADRPESTTVTDRGPYGWAGTTVNQPMRAVTGHNWDGTHLDFRAVPEQYAAIAFHSDDLSDARWASDFSVDTAGLASGIYAVRLQTERGEDRVPLFVTPAGDSPRAAVAVLLPTFTYIAYGNERHWWHHAWVFGEGGDTGSVPDTLGPADRYAAATGMVSLYDHHTDGTGNCHGSRMRPLANIRGDYFHPAIGGPHLLSADLHLTQWLEESGIAYDILTDEELHHEGAAALRPYQAVLTGNHPEYYSAQMLDAVEHYMHGGGHFMYLGGNGFYWVTTVHPTEPHVIEVRRGLPPTGPWQSLPGELNQAFTGEPGGLWCHRGRAPNQLVGVGTAGFVFTTGRPFTRSDQSHDADVDWIFDGVKRPEAIGDSGVIMGAAASFEFDRYDRDLGTPRESVLLATAAHLEEVGQGALEELLNTGRVGAVQADLVYTEYPNGGATFSAGSCGWITSLLENNRDNDVSRITTNILQHFTH